MMSLPSAARFVVIGAGVHGLSTVWHLAKELKDRRLADGAQIVVLDKTGVGAGASGVIRNNYFQPTVRELMARSVGIWESGPDAFSYHLVGYLQISPEAMRADVTTIYEQQRAIGYPSTLVEGTAEARRYMQRIFPGWRAQNVTSVRMSIAAATRTTRRPCGAWPERRRPKGYASSPGQGHRLLPR